MERTHQNDNAGLTPSGLTAEEAFRLFLELTPGGVFRYRDDDQGGTIDYISEELFVMAGCANRAEFDAWTGGCFEGLVHPDDRAKVRASISEQISHGDTDAVIYRLNRRDGKEVWVDDRGRYVIDEQGQGWFYVTVVDITEKVGYERQLERARERMEILTALSNDVVFDIECRTGNAQVFGDFRDRFGRAPRQEDFVVQRRCHAECHLAITEHNLDSLMASISDDSLVDFETSTEGPDGQPVWYRYQSVVLYDEEGNAVRHVGRLLDTHEMMMRESQFRRKAEHDSLTGLYNRSAALNRIETALQAGTTAFTFFLIDVDDFKGINDTYGHPEGDRVLVRLAEFLTAAMRREDVVARLGGDEFAVFANGLGPGAALDRILDHLARGPFATQRSTDAESADATGPAASITIGAVCCTSDDVTFDEVYALADEALYEAKQGGKAQARLRLFEAR